MRYTRRLGGHDLTVTDYVGDHQYAKGTRFDFKSTSLKRETTKLATTISHNWKFRRPYLAPVAMMVDEIMITFKKEAKLNQMSLKDSISC